jgi:hypothetical protein
MNQTDRILTPLEPPPGGWERLRARRDSSSRWAPSWWALASGMAATVAWLAIIAPGHTQIRMPLSGGRLIGERSQGVGVQILGNGRAVALPSADANVRIYWVESTESTPAKTK